MMKSIKYIDTKSGEEYELDYDRWMHLASQGTNTINDAAVKRIEELVYKQAADIPDIDEDPEGYDAWYEGFRKAFVDPRSFKDNWNTYSESWTSPQGVRPIIEIVDIS